MKQKGIIGLAIVSLCGCTSQPMVSPTPLVTQIPIEVVEPAPLEYAFNGIDLTIHANEPFEQSETLIQWITDQQILSDMYIEDWINRLDGLTMDTPIALDQRLIMILENAKLLNEKMDSISPLVLSNTYFNAYDYININSNDSTITIDTPLEFTSIQSLEDYLWAYQLITTMPKMNFNDLTIVKDGLTILLNNTSTYVQITLKDQHNQNAIALNLVHNEAIQAFDLTNESIDRIILITPNPTLIPLLQPYLNELSFDQIDQLIASLQQNDQPIHAIYFKDGQTTFDAKYTYGSTHVTWTTSLDNQLSPILNQ